MPGTLIEVRAPAKINLSLRIVGVRGDGYHELRSIFQSIALHDTLTIRPRRGGFVIHCDDPACPIDRTNLVWRAAERVWAASGRRGQPRDAEIVLTKRIPMQAGLGGGSSDAAAALRGLAMLWRVADRRLFEIAASLGADVPYFLEGGTALGLDRGDVLFPLADYPAAWATLVVPPFGVSTPDAYSWWDGRNEAPRALAACQLRQGRPSATPWADLQNDLQAPVAARHPEISRLVNALRRAGACHAAMSGSGSAVFGLFLSRPHANRAAARLGRESGRRTVVTRILNRAAYQRLAAIRGHRIHLPFAPRRFRHS